MQLLTGKSRPAKKQLLLPCALFLTMTIGAACSVQSSSSDVSSSDASSSDTSSSDTDEQQSSFGQESDTQEFHGSYSPINADNPGQPVELSDHLVAGKTTIFDMYSEYCGPCRAIRPKLIALAQKRSDIAIQAVDINRQGVHGIDWDSPLAHQYNIRSVPHFKIFDPDGHMIAEGTAARDMVKELLDK